jgi:hypothetical protein
MPVWDVMRQGDNGVEVRMSVHDSRVGALARVLVMESGVAHKQAYWISGPPGPAFQTNRDLYLHFLRLGQEARSAAGPGPPRRGGSTSTPPPIWNARSPVVTAAGTPRTVPGCRCPTPRGPRPAARPYGRSRRWAGPTSPASRCAARPTNRRPGREGGPVLPPRPKAGCWSTPSGRCSVSRSPPRCYSRSGVTMVASLTRGLSHEDAARFSFLLATPVILAAGVLKIGPDRAARRRHPRSGAGRQPGLRHRRLPGRTVPGPLLRNPHPHSVRHLLHHRRPRLRRLPLPHLTPHHPRKADTRIQGVTVAASPRTTPLMVTLGLVLLGVAFVESRWRDERQRPTGARCRLARCFVGQLTLTAVSSMTNEVCFV